MKIVSVVAGLPFLLLMLATYPLDAQTAAEPKGPPTVAEAKAFMDDAEARLDKIVKQIPAATLTRSAR